MRARLALVALVLAVAGGGCLAVTGVGDYTVENDTIDLGCQAEHPYATCEQCCAAAHPVEKRAAGDQLRACACTPDRCQTPCSVPDGSGNDFCDDALAGTSDECNTCLEGTVSAGTCPIDHGNAYNRCIAPCS